MIEKAPDHYRMLGKLGEGGMGVVYPRQQTAPLIANWKEIRSSDLAALNNLIQQNVPAIYLSPVAN